MAVVVLVIALHATAIARSVAGGDCDTTSCYNKCKDTTIIGLMKQICPIFFSHSGWQKPVHCPLMPAKRGAVAASAQHRPLEVVQLA